MYDPTSSHHAPPGARGLPCLRLGAGLAIADGPPQLPDSYPQLLADIKARIQQARTRAAVSVNSELIRLYWEIGRAIVERQREEGWGAAVIVRLSADLRVAFPGLRGFSPSNIHGMRAFYLAYSQRNTEPAPTDKPLDAAILQQAVGELPDDQMPTPLAAIPWGHNALLVQRIKDLTERLWYAQQTLEHGWSRAVLAHQIDSGLYQRQGQAVTNFERTLPPPQSDLAQRLLKDPYAFEFLGVAQAMSERTLERKLTERLRDLFLELGRGFAFVGSQYRIEVGGEDFFIDLLFYHVRLHRFVLIDLKTGKFKPEHVGKMGFYLTAVDRQLRHPQDEPSIGLILCRVRNRVVAEYALHDLTRPLGVATYRLLPAEIRRQLPSPEELEEGLSRRGEPGPE